MGKNLIQQRRGKGTSKFRSPSFRFKGAAKHINVNNEVPMGKIVDIIHCAGHSAPLIQVEFGKEPCLTLAAEGLKVGDMLEAGKDAQVKSGNVLLLKNIPEGTSVFNIEGTPGDGGKFIRSSGTVGKVLFKSEKKVTVLLPSKKQKDFNPGCRATIGVVAGGGRTLKPIMKAGVAFHRAKARNKMYPTVSGSAMNAVDHPFGNKRSSRKARAKPVGRNAPPGRKVGYIAARRTGPRK